MKTNKFSIIIAICDRIEKEGIDYPFDRLSAAMDLEYSNVNLDALLNADRSTFFHDVNGIFTHMDRVDRRLGGCFVPRVGLL